MDLYGAMADGDALVEVCAEFGVPLIEDAAESLGARRSASAGGGYGAAAVLSFNGNKIVTTGGGGALVSDDGDLIERARYLSTQARQPVAWYEHTDIGFNYRMGSLNAAVGRGQLRTLAERIAARRRVRAAYMALLSGLEGVTFQEAGPDSQPNHWLTTVQIDRPGITPSLLVERLSSQGIEARHGFKPMHLQPVFDAHPVIGGAVASHHFATAISLPTGRHIDIDDIERICEVIVETCAS